MFSVKVIANPGSDVPVPSKIRFPDPDPARHQCDANLLHDSIFSCVVDPLIFLSDLDPLISKPEKGS